MPKFEVHSGNGHLEQGGLGVAVVVEQPHSARLPRRFPNLRIRRPAIFSQTQVKSSLIVGCEKWKFYSFKVISFISFIKYSSFLPLSFIIVANYEYLLCTSPEPTYTYFIFIFSFFITRNLYYSFFVTKQRSTLYRSYLFLYYLHLCPLLEDLYFNFCFSRFFIVVLFVD